jgi:flagellar basal-body rod protein FlgB
LPGVASLLRYRDTSAMAISDLPILSMLRTKMQWHQERQRLLSENVANADTPKFRPRDLNPPAFDRPAPAQVALAATNTAHLTGLAGGNSRFASSREGGYEARPSGNAVSLEDEMMKVASNQMDYQAATTLYSRSLGLVKTALGKR